MMNLSRLFDLLAPYSPTLAGTFPLGLQVEGSDLDVLCYAPDLDAFERDLRALSAHIDGFTLGRVATTPEAVVATFESSGLPVEVFGQPRPVERQNAFVHMIVEGRLLSIGGARLRRAVLALKRRGVKTEPAFALILGLPGDPYEAILELCAYSDGELEELVRAADLERGEESP